VADGGRLIVLKGGMAHNEWGDARDTSAFIQSGKGARLVDGANIYAYGKGEVICIDSINALEDVVRDGGQALQSRPNAENLQRKAVYQRVLTAVLDRYQLQEPVRLLPAAATSQDTFNTLDWRAAKVDNAWIVAAVQTAAEQNSGIPVQLRITKRIKSVVNLIDNQRLDPKSLKIGPAPTLLRIELAN
jgi:hypothetical protein